MISTITTPPHHHPLQFFFFLFLPKSEIKILKKKKCILKASISEEQKTLAQLPLFPVLNFSLLRG
jgi:hypothetical protein